MTSDSRRTVIRADFVGDVLAAEREISEGLDYSVDDIRADLERRRSEAATWSGRRTRGLGSIRGVNPVVARVMSTLAGQLGNPHGLLGKGVGAILNRGNRPLIAGCVEAAEVAAGGAAADVGFGGGVGLSLLLGRVGAAGTVHGVELSQDMLAWAKSRFTREVGEGRLRVLAGSLTELPLADAGLDAVITVNTLYFVPELDRACTELARVLRPQGRVVVGVGDPDGMAKLPFTGYGFRLRPVAELTAGLENAGLSVDHREIGQKAFPGHLLIGRPA